MTTFTGSRHRADWCRVLILVAAMLAVATANAAGVTSSVVVNSLEPDFLDRFSIHNAPSGAVSSFLDFDDIPNYGDFHATGTAAAGFRTLGGSAQVLTPFYTPAAFDSSTLIQTQSTFSDSLTLGGSGTGFVRFAFHLSGNAANSHPDILRSYVTFIFNAAGDRRLGLFSGSLGFYPTGTFMTSLIPVTFGLGNTYIVPLPEQL